MTESAPLPAASSDLAEAEIVRLKHYQAWRDRGVDPYDGVFRADSTPGGLQTKYQDLPNGEISPDHARVSGRIATIRNSGMFIDLHGPDGKIQIFHDVKHLAPERAEVLGLFDIGDIVGVEGALRRTPRGELTINAERMVILSKCLQPPPEKFHGLADPEVRLRKRVMDISTNADLRAGLQMRCRIVSAIRRAFEDRGYLDVETPMLHTIPGGANAKPFVTHHNALDIPLYLRIAPELHLKKLIVAGLADRVFEIGRCFRNEGISFKHNPEFTSVEAYMALGNCADMMALAEEITVAAIRAAQGESLIVRYGDRDIDFTPPWPRKTMIGLVKEATGLDFMTLTDPVEARLAASKIGVDTPPHALWGQIVESVFGAKVEKTLIHPTHVMEHPRDISPLAKVKADNPLVADRFEAFVNGWELCNGFSELNDPFDQYGRFKAQMAARATGDDEAQYMDESFVEALEYGLPPAGGLGIGIDRLVMLLTNSQTIREVLSFPAFRPGEGASVVRRVDESKTPLS
ncbi:MAG: lysine--tRNA ligase [Rhodospirillales bacterium]|nr:lysine--tRNA ligase [Rhodospirillales bacterium]